MTTPTPPVPARWYRDAPPRDLRQRFLAAVADVDPEATALNAWAVILDAWRVVEVADARSDDDPRTANACAEREVWLAALRVAIFRADHAHELTTPL